MADIRPSKSGLRAINGPPCQGLRPDGGNCSAKRIAGSDYCFFHDPDKEAERRAAQSAGGQRNKMAVLPSSAPDAKLQSAEDVPKLLAETINQVRRGEIDPKIANSVGYLAALLLKAQREAETERRLAALESAILRQRTGKVFNIDSKEDPEWIPPSREEHGNDQ